MTDVAVGDALTPFATPGDALAAQAATRPDAEAMVFPQSDARMTFGQWHDRATALARSLLDLGFAPGDHIAILAESRVEWPVAQLGIAMMGGVMVPLNTYYQRDDLSYALTQSNAANGYGKNCSPASSPTSPSPSMLRSPKITTRHCVNGCTTRPDTKPAGSVTRA